jgi:hypothetical protein
MLPSHNGIPLQIADVRDAWPSSVLDDHPTNVGPPKSMLGSVGIEIGVGVAVMSTVTTSPPVYGTFNRTSACYCQGIFERTRRVVSAVSPQPMVASRNPYAKYHYFAPDYNKGRGAPSPVT